MKIAVKALIYDKDKNILLQKRDKTKRTQFKNAWGLFGGKVEKGEKLISALKRELIEELGSVPGRIQKKLFKWIWHGKNPAINYVYPVFYKDKHIALHLFEGQKMEWMKIAETKKLILDPLTNSNLKIIESFLNKSKS